MKKSLYEVVDDIDKSKYITLEQVEEIFERKTAQRYLSKYVSDPLILKSEGKYYYLKEEIMNWNKFRLECLPIQRLLGQYRDQGLAINGLLAELRKNEIDIVKNNQHPFNFGAVIKPEDIENVHKIIQKKLKIDNAKTCKEKYDILNEDLIIKKNMINTMGDFDRYAISRFNSKPSDRCLHNPVSQAKVLIQDMFNKELYLYSKEDIYDRIAMVYNDIRIPKGVKIEFVYFINYLIEKRKMGINKFGVNQSILYNKTDKQTYSREQILDLFGLLYSSLSDRNTLNIALENRGCAVVWLYMFIHYVVFWRTSTIRTIPQPQLELIGFSTGDDFLAWLKDPDNTFTEDMGQIICKSVKVKIDSLEIRAKKNNIKLVFEYGRLMSIGLGMLLAICEAHRRVACIKRNNGDNSRADLENIITNSYGDKYYYDKLFGGKIEEILNSKVFGNLPMERAFSNYTLDYTEGNNNPLGMHLLSIMRSHKIDSRGISNTTPLYETRVEEGTIGDIVAIVEEIGSFGFAKDYLMRICDDKYSQQKLSEKHQQIKALEITSNQAENLVKTVAQRRAQITQLLVKMVVNPDIAKGLLEKIATGKDVSGKHDHSKCLLKAFLQLVDTKKDDVVVLNLGEDELIEDRCLMPKATKCFSCPLLIGQLFLLNEIGEVINDAISILENSNNDFEKKLQTSLVFESYLPILYEAQDAFSNEVVAAHINLDNIANRLNLLEENGKLLFE